MTVVSQPEAVRRRPMRVMLNLLVLYGVLPIIIALMYLGFGLIEPAFHSGDNAINILKQASYLAIIATGQMFALLTRGFDLSVGQLLSLVSVSSGLVMLSVLEGSPDAIVLAILAGCAVGLCAGLAAGTVNGVCVSVFRINPFVVTLGMQGICMGFATTLSDGFPVFNLPVELTDTLSRGTVIGIPVPLIGAILVLVTAYVILNHSVLGRSLYVIGSNPRAAYVAGLHSRLHLTFAYVICSLFVTIGAFLLTARTGSGEPNLGGGLVLQSIAAAVIGGVSLRGGEGKVIHAVYGALFVTILSIGMNLIRVDGTIQQIILGIVVVAAVYLDLLRTRIR